MRVISIYTSYVSRRTNRQNSKVSTPAVSDCGSINSSSKYKSYRRDLDITDSVFIRDVSVSSKHYGINKSAIMGAKT